MHQQQDVDKMEKSKNQKKITVLKLVNNRTFNIEETRNLCFVNATIQILHSIPDIRTYFKTVDYVASDPNSFTVSKELTRIFQNGGKSSVSAAKLRKLIGQSSGRNDISDGSQQDFMDFHSLLLKVLWDELLMKGDVYGLSLIHQFYGKEKNEKKFIHTQKASCSQGHSTRTEEEDFQTIKLAVPVSSQDISLNNLISNHYAECSNKLSMKCSDCCPHKKRCPQTGKCKLMEAVSQRKIVSTPKYLYIQLQRFSSHLNQKK